MTDWQILNYKIDEDCVTFITRYGIFVFVMRGAGDVVNLCLLGMIIGDSILYDSYDFVIDNVLWKDMQVCQPIPASSFLPNLSS